MKLRISEMFEDATVNLDNIHINEDAGIDKEKIRQMVFHKINGQTSGVKNFSVKTKKSLGGLH
ncbi:MAG: hypothetical protein K0Q73_8839 [Paenibacillus sp.]|nr:hypothetical protein [Paenibacillus sp.]